MGMRIVIGTDIAIGMGMGSGMSIGIPIPTDIVTEMRYR